MLAPNLISATRRKRPGAAPALRALPGPVAAAVRVGGGWRQHRRRRRRLGLRRADRGRHRRRGGRRRQMAPGAAAARRVWERRCSQLRGGGGAGTGSARGCGSGESAAIEARFHRSGSGGSPDFRGPFVEVRPPGLAAATSAPDERAGTGRSRCARSDRARVRRALPRRPGLCSPRLAPPVPGGIAGVGGGGGGAASGSVLANVRWCSGRWRGLRSGFALIFGVRPWSALVGGGGTVAEVRIAARLGGCEILGIRRRRGVRDRCLLIPLPVAIGGDRVATSDHQPG